MSVIDERDEFITNLLTQNIDVFYNGLNLKRGTYNLLEIIRKDINVGMEEIKKIKHCIFEGYKLNIATYNNKTKTYEMDYKNIPLKLIETPLINPLPMVEEIQQSVPKKIIVSSVNVISNYFEPGMYSFSAGDCVSVLDGFINLDESFITQYP